MATAVSALPAGASCLLVFASVPPCFARQVLVCFQVWGAPEEGQGDPITGNGGGCRAGGKPEDFETNEKLTSGDRALLCCEMQGILASQKIVATQQKVRTLQLSKAEYVQSVDKNSLLKHTHAFQSRIKAAWTKID